MTVQEPLGWPNTCMCAIPRGREGWNGSGRNRGCHVCAGHPREGLRLDGAILDAAYTVVRLCPEDAAVQKE